MRALVLNLDRETGRMAFQRRQLDRLGIDFDRMTATTPDRLDPPPDAPYWQGWQRPLRPAEMAAMASHLACWQRIAAGTAPMLVLEDDALLMPGTRGFLDRIAGLDGIDHVSLETRGRRKLVARRPHPAAPIRRLWQDRSGAAAYVLWPAGAALLAGRARRAPGLADALIAGTSGLASWQADPALAVQIDQCARYGLAPPIPVESAILARPRPTGRSPAQRVRRIGAQLRMGLRAALRGPGAERVEILPAGQPGDAAA